MAFPTFGKDTEYLVIDMATSNLKLVSGRYNQKTGVVTIDKAGIVPLESDTINDGQVTDSFSVIMALKHAVARMDIPTRETIITTDAASIYTRDLELPYAKSEQLKDMVKYEILGGQSSSNRDMVVDYVTYGKTTDEETGAEKIKIRATAIPKDTASDYRDILKNADLTPSVLDINANALRKLFSSGMINGSVNVANSTLLLIELSGKSTTITVLDKGFPVLSRRLNFGHNNIRQVAESVKKMQGGGEKQSSLARRLNITKVDSETEVPIEDIDVWHESVAEEPSLKSAVSAYFKNLTDSVSRTAQFSISKFHMDSISTCFLYGSGAQYKKIDRELSSQLGTQVEVLNTLSTVVGPKTFVVTQFVNCCGALIRED